MDFEVAVWEMTQLMVAPKKVFRNVYYRVCHTIILHIAFIVFRNTTDVWQSPGYACTRSSPCTSIYACFKHNLTILQKQTKNTYTSSDPAFPYMLLFFTFLTSLAWSIAYATPSPVNIIRIALTFTAVHCLLGSLVAALVMYFFVGRALGPGGWLVSLGRPGGALGGLAGRRRGLFGDVGMEGGRGGAEELEFGYCFDVGYSSSFLLVCASP
jgi:hypothetical protein